MTNRKGPASVAVVLALILSVSASGASQRRNQQEQQKGGNQAGAAQPIGPQPANKEELDAYLAVQNEQNPANKIALADAFVMKFPNSDFVGNAHTMRMTIYNQAGKFKESIAAAEQAREATVKLGEKMVAKAEADAKIPEKDRKKNVVYLDKDSPQFQAFMTQTEQRILAYYQTIMAAYQQLNDAPKVLEYGERALGFKPDDMNTLMTVSNVMAERPPLDEKEREKQMKRAEELAAQAVTQLPTFIASPAGTQMTEAQKSDLTSSVHYTLGLVYLQQKRFPDSEKEFLTAVKSKADPVSYYRLGIAYAQERQNDQSMDALAKSVFLKGVSEAPARDMLKQLYVMKNKSEEGLEDYIKTAGQKISQ